LHFLHNASLASGLTAAPPGSGPGRISFPTGCRGREAAGLRGQRALTGRETGGGVEGGGQGHRLRVAGAAERGQQPRDSCTCEHRDFQLSVFHRSRISSGEAAV